MWGFWKKDVKISDTWRWIALVTYVAMLVVNGFAGSTSLLGGKNTGEISDAYSNLFAPAGLTFAIWGVIYLLLGVFFFRAFEIWNTGKKTLPNKKFNRLLKLFSVSSVLNIAWLFAWQYEVFWLSVVLMILLLGTLGFAHQITTAEKLGRLERLAIRVPFSVYFGWITVATIANITTWLVSVGWDGWGFSDVVWTIVILIVGAVIGTLTAIRLNDWVYLAVFVWAYFGILYKHLADDGFAGQYTAITVTLSVLIGLLLATIPIVAVRMIQLKDIDWKKVGDTLFN
jgi:hypothetical protein